MHHKSLALMVNVTIFCRIYHPEHDNPSTSHHHALLRLQQQILAVILVRVAGVSGAGPRLRFEDYKWGLSLQFEVQQQL